MEQPTSHLEKWTILLLVLSYIVSSRGSLLSENIVCDDSYDCSTEHSPFAMEQQYFYTFDVNSTLNMEKSVALSEFDFERKKSIVKQWSILVIPISSCETILKFSSPASPTENQETSLKVTFHNGSIHRVCSSQSSTQLKLNTLKAFASLLQTNYENSVLKSVGLSNGIVFEHDSKGRCPTKYIHCPSNPNRVLKFKSIKMCGSNDKNLLRTRGKAELDEFHESITAFMTSQPALCSTKADSIKPAAEDEFVNYHIKDLTVCTIDKKVENGQAIVTSAHCGEIATQLLEEVIYGSASLSLQRTIPHNLRRSNLTFYKNTIAQSRKLNSIPSSRPVYENEYNLSDIVEILTNPLRWRNLSTHQIQGLIKQAQFQSENEDLTTFLNTQISLKVPEEKIVYFLNILTPKIACENILDFFKKFLQNHKATITKLRLESTLSELLQNLATAENTVRIIEFCKFLVDFVHDEQNNISHSVTTTAVITFTKHLNTYCDRMTDETQGKFCLHNKVVQEWINSTIVEKLESDGKYLDEFIHLEALLNVKKHVKFSCDQIYEIRKGDSLSFWAILNCYRKDPCNTDGKKFLRSILTDTKATQNTRISAFLVINKCFTEEDGQVIQNIFKNANSNASELQRFIRKFKINRDFYGITEQFLVIPDDANLKAVQISTGDLTEKSKIASSSNTFTSIQIPKPYLKLYLETNVLYFDTPAVINIPQMITLTVGTFARGIIGTPLIEFEILVDDFRNPEQENSFDFLATVLIRKLSRTVYVSEITLSQEKLIELVQFLYTRGATLFQTNFDDKIIAFLQNALNIDNFQFAHLVDLNFHIPSILGIPQAVSWSLDGFLRFNLEKTACAGVNREISCRFNIKPEMVLEGKVSVGIGSLEESGTMGARGYSYEVTVANTFPLHLTFNENNKGMDQLISLTLPIFSAISTIETRVLEFDDGPLTSLAKWAIVTDPNERTTINFLLSPKSKKITLNFNSLNVWATAEVEVTSYPLHGIRGNLTSWIQLNAETKHELPGLSFQFGVQNTENEKKLHMVLHKGEDTYSLETFYIRKFQNAAESYSASYFGCRSTKGTGILCTWPLCMFCGSEDHFEAILSTPTFKNVEIFKGSITQEFPNKKLDFLLQTSRIPILKDAHIKVSVSHGNDSLTSSAMRFRDKMNTKWSHMTSILRNISNLSEDLYFDAYFLNSEFFSEYFGTVSGTLTFLSRYLSGGSASVKFMPVLAEVKYPIRGNEKEMSLMLSYQIEETATNAVSNIEAAVRSSQFPVADLDLLHIRTTPKDGIGRQDSCIIRPLNLLQGHIKLDVNDKAYGIYNAGSWSNFHFDQTYIVYIPPHFHTNIFKGSLALKREFNKWQKAGVELQLGIDNGFEIHYNVLPEKADSLELLATITANGETYGLHNKIEPANDASEVSDDVEDDTRKYKYKGVYVIGEESMRAAGIFLASKDRELLPFSQFDIQVLSKEGNDLGIRIYGMEKISHAENIHTLKFGLDKQGTKVFELVNEINPSDQIPIKATLLIKDKFEAKIFDNSKIKNKVNLQVKAKWLPNPYTIQGKISFPTTWNNVAYLDLDLKLVNGTNEVDSTHLSSSSSVQFDDIFSVTSKNAFKRKQQEWELGLETLYDKRTDDTLIRSSFKIINMTFLSYFVAPGPKNYLINTVYQDLYNDTVKKSKKYLLRAERPEVTPLHLEISHERLNNYIYESEDDLYSLNQTEVKIFKGKVCHKDNFLYLFPMLNVDFSAQSELLDDSTYNNNNNDVRYTRNGKAVCSSIGAPWLLFCNNVNLTYSYKSEHEVKYSGPWIANMTVRNHLTDYIDELVVNLHATYDKIQEADSTTYFSHDLVQEILKTVYGDFVLKHHYNFEYDLHRIVHIDLENSSKLGINGSYTLTRMFESLDFFEFSDKHRWSHDSGNLHIWANLLNHTTDSNLTSESATFSSQYVSLGESESSNITWMELRSSLNSNGFGTLQTIFQQPSTIFAIYEATIDADLVIKTEFSPVKMFRIMVSHDHSKNEYDDDDSLKFDTLTKFNGIFNEKEVSGSNAMTLAVGKLYAVGNTLLGNYKNDDEILEYLTIKTFAMYHANLLPLFRDSDRSLVHFDISSSWTNAEDDDTDIKIAADAIFYSNKFPLIRLFYAENNTASSDLELQMERNASIFLYHSNGHKTHHTFERLPETMVAETLIDLSFTQVSLQSLSHQIVEDFYNVTGINQSEDSTSDEDQVDKAMFDIHLDIRANKATPMTAMNSQTKAKFFWLDQGQLHCQSFFERCTDDGVNSTNKYMDTSNYCNVVIFPIKISSMLRV